jgi:hypothetical protein
MIQWKVYRTTHEGTFFIGTFVGENNTKAALNEANRIFQHCLVSDDEVISINSIPYKEFKSLYDNEYRYTADASDLSQATEAALHSIFDKYIKMGYSPREISHIMNGVILDFELSSVI